MNYHPGISCNNNSSLKKQKYHPPTETPHDLLVSPPPNKHPRLGPYLSLLICGVLQDIRGVGKAAPLIRRQDLPPHRQNGNPLFPPILGGRRKRPIFYQAGPLFFFFLQRD